MNDELSFGNHRECSERIGEEMRDARLFPCDDFKSSHGPSSVSDDQTAASGNPSHNMTSCHLYFELEFERLPTVGLPGDGLIIIGRREETEKYLNYY